MVSLCCSNSRVKHKGGDAVPSNFVDEDYVIDGVIYPRYVREIDDSGFECSHHTLKFHGCDWDIPLAQRREDLTKFFIEDASDATGEPEDNIKDLRFLVSGTCLLARFVVRHQVAVSAGRVQSELVHHDWQKVKSLYQPREEKKHSSPLVVKEERQNTLESLKPQLSCNLNQFGRPNTGKEVPRFRNEKDTDEEPFPYELQRSASGKLDKIYPTINII